MTLGSFGNFQSEIRQVGRLEGSAIVNRQAFSRNDFSAVYTPVGMGNRVNLFITYYFSDLSIFTDPNFKFFGLNIGWSLANFDANKTNFPQIVRTNENEEQLQGGTDPFSLSVYNEPAVTVEDNADLPVDHKASKMDYNIFEFPYTRLDAPLDLYGQNGLVLPLIARGDILVAYVALETDPGWPGFGQNDYVQIDAAIGANAQ